jgi:hypothetical protein
VVQTSAVIITASALRLRSIGFFQNVLSSCQVVKS